MLRCNVQAVPFMEIIEVLALWFCISVPMVFLGAYFGYRKPVEPYPVVTSNIPRQVCIYLHETKCEIGTCVFSCRVYNQCGSPSHRAVCYYVPALTCTSPLLDVSLVQAK